MLDTVLAADFSYFLREIGLQPFHHMRKQLSIK